MINSNTNKEAIFLNKLIQDKWLDKRELIFKYTFNRDPIKFPFKGYVVFINHFAVILIKDNMHIISYYFYNKYKSSDKPFKIDESLARTYLPAYRISKEEYNNWLKLISK